MRWLFITQHPLKANETFCILTRFTRKSSKENIFTAQKPCYTMHVKAVRDLSKTPTIVYLHTHTHTRIYAGLRSI